LDEVINPFVLYAGIALGAVGVLLALPRKGVNPQIVGAVIALGALGLVLVGLGVRAQASGQLPNIYFYLFSAIALGGSLRVITHKRPVYAALYFILTILASAGLYLLLSAEFMAFALIIVYAGAILITYLFVIMLATEAPSEERLEALSDYDLNAREPLLAAGVGFVLLAGLTSMLFSGSVRLPDAETVLAGRNGDEVLIHLPARVEKALLDAGLIQEGEVVARNEVGEGLIDPQARTVTVVPAGSVGLENARQVDFPEGYGAKNVESLAYDFLHRHPGNVEMAGVILLMAMLGAVVLSRRRVEMDEQAKARMSGHLNLEDSP